ncbi:hypothetical protein [Caenimonas aquaedulcis]|uniref:Uncharacterized protein n=1 Tax=Caenimonas aquaedulcis TaxID=2793270 RepID=A0A931H7I1_9BURK|nr:hypothetical protein [Caenimonas aquaedulcis]MBG9389877.1 hypothetical protein [Caenimonas aquaedulcis]
MGTQLTSLIVEGFVHDSEPVTLANVIYLLSERQWHRFAIDHGTIHWRDLSSHPVSPNSVGNAAYPWRSMDRELELPTAISGFSVSGQWPNVRVEFKLENGHVFVVFSSGEAASYHAV